MPSEAPGDERQAVLAPITEAAIFLVLTANHGSEDEIRGLLADVGGLTRAVGFRAPEAQLTCVTGVGALVWDRLFGQPRPAGLHVFSAITGPKHTAPSTPGDLLFHIRARRFDLCFELAQRLMARLAGHVGVADEVHGFRSFDLRDVLGFVDGTENPPGQAAVTAVEVGDDDPSFQGGSYVVVQKYLHDLAGWDALPVEEQERIVGRYKLSDIEMLDEVKPDDSHVALNTIVVDGEERQIVRYNMPFGRVGAGEYGTYFIGYVGDTAVIEQMLENMFVGRPPGRYDRILDFSTAVTGNLFYVPTVDFLEDPPTALEVPGDIPVETAGAEAAPADGTANGSLNIGSLKGVL